MRGLPTSMRLPVPRRWWVALVGCLAPVAAGAGPPDLTSDWLATGPAGEGFAFAAATAGDVNGDGYSDLIVGAPSHMHTWVAEGRVYLYYGSETGLAGSADWSYVGGQAQCQFGWSVAPAGDTDGDGYDDFLVGAPGYSNGQTFEGRVFLFAGGKFFPSLLRTFEMNEAGAEFGQSVSWAGDVNGDGYDDILAGAPLWGGFGSPFYVPIQGGAALYLGGPNGPDATADWSPRGGQEDMLYGYSVAGLGDVNADGYADIMVGAPRYDPGTLDSNHGAAYCYLGSATGPSSTASWQMVGDGSGDEFGSRVAFAGDGNGNGYADALIGAPGYTATGGAFYFCRGSATGLGNVTRFSNLINDWGISLSGVGDVDSDGFADLVIGSNANVAHLYCGTALGPVIWGSSPLGSSHGRVVSGAGDVNGDGAADLLITAPASYQVRVFHGGRKVDSPPRLRFSVEGAPAAGLGGAIDGAGDVNGDGLDDLIVGAPTAGSNQQGEVQLFLGASAGTPSIGWSVTGTTPEGRLGAAVALAGDVNDDGYDDVVIGEPGADRVRVHHGSASGLSATPSWTYQHPQAGAELGAAVSGAGDFNGDGFADILVGAPSYDETYPDQGLVLLFLGSPAGIASGDGQSRTLLQAGARFGASVSGASDVHGDGYDDLLVGAPGYDATGIVDCGGVFVFSGNAGGLGVFSSLLRGGSAGDALGSSVSSAGDVNGDGFADIIAGAPLHDDGVSTDVGYVRIYLGSDAVPFASWYPLIPAQPSNGAQFGRSVDCAGDLRALGRTDVVIASSDPQSRGQAAVYGFAGAALSLLGTMPTGEPGTEGCVAGAGDLDGDGLPEAAVGGPAAASSGRGKFWVYSAHILASDHAPAALPRITDLGGGPIALHGRVAAPHDLRFSMSAWSPVGRARLRLEWQVASTVTPFGALGQGAWRPTNAPAMAATPLSEPLETPLGAGERHRWRMRTATSNPYHPKGRWITDAPNTPSLYGVTVAAPTSIGDAIPRRDDPVAVMQAPYPNPFNPSTTIRFRLGQAAHVQLRVVDLAGRQVRTLYAGALAAAAHEFRWDGRDGRGRPAASGSYLVVLDAGASQVWQRAILIK